MKEFITFNLVVEKQDNVQIDVDPIHIESLVDGKVLNNPEVTQINMSSGLKFFVSHTLVEVRLKINK